MTENDIIINNEIVCTNEFHSISEKSDDMFIGERFTIEDFKHIHNTILLHQSLAKTYKYCIITYSEFFSNFESQEERRIRIAKGFVDG